jgi:hypothetical protein
MSNFLGSNICVEMQDTQSISCFYVGTRIRGLFQLIYLLTKNLFIVQNINLPPMLHPPSSLLRINKHDYNIEKYAPSDLPTLFSTLYAIPYYRQDVNERQARNRKKPHLRTQEIVLTT